MAPRARGEEKWGVGGSTADFSDVSQYLRDGSMEGSGSCDFEAWVAHNAGLHAGGGAVGRPLVSGGRGWQHSKILESRGWAATREPGREDGGGHDPEPYRVGRATTACIMRDCIGRTRKPYRAGVRPCPNAARDRSEALPMLTPWYRPFRLAHAGAGERAFLRNPASEISQISGRFPDSSP